MKEFVFWYSTEIVYKAGFMAKNKEEAEQLLKKVFIHSEISLDELPEFWNKTKDWNNSYSPETLEEMKEN